MSARFRRFARLLPALLVIVALGLLVAASRFNSASGPAANRITLLPVHAVNGNGIVGNSSSYPAAQQAPGLNSASTLPLAADRAYSPNTNGYAQASGAGNPVQVPGASSIAPQPATMPTPAAYGSNNNVVTAATPAPMNNQIQPIGVTPPDSTGVTPPNPVATPLASEPMPPQTTTQAQPKQPNPFVRTGDDHLSTFALDVDTGSYGAARNYINAGTLPPADTVRVEEFVNYFHYDYSVPEGSTFGIYVDSAPSPFNTGKTQIVRVGIQGQRIDNSQRKDAVLTFVIDVSGSMAEPNRLPLVKQALHLLVNELRDTDQVAIVVFGSQARQVLDYTGGANRDSIVQAIDSLENEGSTNTEEGLRMGYELASKHYKEGAVNRVILCSDGVANVGDTSPQGILKSIEEYTKQGIVLTTVGFGMGDYNDALMEQLADKGNGNYAYVDTLAEAQRIFVENLTGTLQIIAKDAKVQVDFNPAVVSSYRLIGYENRDIADNNFRNDKVDAGEIGAGHSVTALYEVQLADDKSLGSSNSPALTVQLRYADPKSGQVIEQHQPFKRSDFGDDFLKATARYQLAVAVAGFADNLRGSSYESGGSLSDVLAITQRIAPRLVKDKDVQEFAQLVQRAAEIKK